MKGDQPSPTLQILKNRTHSLVLVATSDESYPNSWIRAVQKERIAGEPVCSGQKLSWAVSRDISCDWGQVGLSSYNRYEMILLWLLTNIKFIRQDAF